MRLRADKNFRMTDILTRRSRQISLGHLVEIVAGLQHREAEIIEIEEGLQIVELISAAYRCGICIRQPQAIALRQREQRVWFKRAFEMHMQFGFRQAAMNGEIASTDMSQGVLF